LTGEFSGFSGHYEMETKLIFFAFLFSLMPNSDFSAGKTRFFENRRCTEVLYTQVPGSAQSWISVFSIKTADLSLLYRNSGRMAEM